MNNNYKSIILSTLALALLSASVSTAKTVSPEEALERAATGRTAQRVMKKMTSKSSAVLAHTFTTETASPMVYVFNKGTDNGYLITPADDDFPEILGYSDSGSFDLETAPPAMKWFIGQMAAEMEYALSKSGDNKTSYVIAADPEWESVEPLLPSIWDQGAPFYNSCPTSGSYRTYTGCVATSMAQVMYYHKWPDVGVGSNSYTWETGNKTLSLDFSTITFDWDNMIDDYSGSYTTAQANAVAQLMYACGISVDMDYDTSASGAASMKQARALPKYFKYSKDIRYVSRDLYSAADFEKLIYDNLAEGLPVLYNGTGDAGGHSFVCDGYSTGHYFHFNWGWSGSSDGYFYLNHLDPSSLGTGGGSGGFNTKQGISYNIRPVKDGNDTGTAQEASILCPYNFTCSSTGSNLTTSSRLTFRCIDFESNYGYFWNFSGADFSGYLGVIAVDSDGSETFFKSSSSYTIEPGTGYAYYYATLSNLSAGTYKVYPGYQLSTSSTYKYTDVANGYTPYINLTVSSDKKLSFTSASIYSDETNAPELTLNNFSYAGDIYTNTNHSFTSTVTNSSDMDYYGPMTMNLYNSSGTVVDTTNLGQYSIPAGRTESLSFSLLIDVAVGSYTVKFADGYGNILPGEYPLVISYTGSSLTSTLQCTSFSPTEIEPNLSTSTTVYFDIKNTSSRSVSQPTFAIYYKDSSTSNYTFLGGAQWTNSTISGSSSGITFGLSGLSINLDAGIYEFYVAYRSSSTSSFSIISHPFQVRVGYPVTGVALEYDEIWIKKGDTWPESLNATVSPQNATFSTVSWTSSNPDVASIDSDGNLTAHELGTAYISASTYNGHTAHTLVTVNGTFTGIEEVAADATEDTIEAVFTANGLKVLDHPTAAEVDALPRGLYIVKGSNSTRKLSK